MKKQYSKPLTEEVIFSAESILAGSIKSVSGMDDVTPSNDKPVSFSKKHQDLWGFDDED